MAALGAALAAAALGAPGVAHAQACCTGAALVVPRRLRPGEEAALGAELRAATVVGSHDADAAWVPSPRGAAEHDFAEDLFGVVRVLDRAQLGALVPLVETWRKAPGRREAGGGLGDVVASARWDFTLAGMAGGWPGIAVLAGAVIPTGRPVDRAEQPLATDATGEGTWRVDAGAQVEHAWGRTFASGLASVAWHAPRAVAGLDVQRGWRLDAQVALGRAVAEGASVALVGALGVETATRVDGAPAEGSAQRRVRLGLAGGVALAPEWRVQASVLAPLPLRGAGANDVATIACAAALSRVWL